MEGLPFPLQDIKVEIKAICDEHPKYKDLERFIGNFKLDAKNPSEDRYLKFLLRCYTEEASYSRINKLLAANDFSKMQKYMASVLL